MGVPLGGLVGHWGVVAGWVGSRGAKFGPNLTPKLPIFSPRWATGAPNRCPTMPHPHPHLPLTPHKLALGRGGPRLWWWCTLAPPPKPTLGGPAPSQSWAKVPIEGFGASTGGCWGGGGKGVGCGWGGGGWCLWVWVPGLGHPWAGLGALAVGLGGMGGQVLSAQTSIRGCSGVPLVCKSAVLGAPKTWWGSWDLG